MAESQDEEGSEEVQINFRASRSQKERWKDHAEEDGFRSFSEFLRVAVEKEVTGEHQEGVGTPDTTGRSASTMSELMEKTQVVNNRLEALTDDVQIIKREVTEDDDLRDLKKELYSNIPDPEDDFEEIELSMGGKMDTFGATVQRLSETVDAEEVRVRAALRSLIDDNLVNSVEDDGETYYYREG